MAQTVVGLFDSASEAQAAVQALTSSGFTQDQVDLANRGTQTDTRSATDSYYTGEGASDSISGFFNSLFGGSDDAKSYSTVASNSNSIVTVHAESAEQANRAAEILDQNGAIDVDERYTQYSSQTSGATATNFTDTANVRTSAEGDISVPVIEENLAVGKRTVESGGVRLRSRVIERPVEESLRLREEHVFVQRNPVNRQATEADFNTFREGEITVTEHAEVPVVAKEARVVEEVSLGKETSERVETITDTVRRTDVEVEEINTNLDVDADRAGRANS